MDALIVADGDIPPRAVVEQLFAGGRQRPLVIAADGGALKAESLGLLPDAVVGDLDSLDAQAVERLRRRSVGIIEFPADKNESDTELALREALARGADRIVVIGALGGPRVEHSLANVLLLAAPGIASRDVAIVDRASTLRLVAADGAGTLELHGTPGDYVSLLPLSPRVDGVTTSGLAYELHDATLHQGPARGLSNELTAETASVSTHRGRLLVIHTRRAEV